MRKSLVLIGILSMAIDCRKPSVVDAVPPVRSEAIPNPPPTSAREFGSLFCAVLNHLPSAATWGYCARYFDPAGAPAALGAAIGHDYRVVVVPGIFGQCVEQLASPFEDAKRHLLDVHQIDVEYKSVPGVGGTVQNAAEISAYLDRQFAGSDQRPYIAIGYSQGASDLLEAVNASPQTAHRIAAIVTIAGSVLGSRLADNIPRNLLAQLQSSRIATCDIGDGKGLDDLHRKERVTAMAAFRPAVRPKLYSVAAVSTRETTSKVLQGSWDALSPFSLEQDSQMLHEDAIAPGATYLGIARGDHWAVALPFESAVVSDPQLKKLIDSLVDQNHYPRPALLEAVIRFVMADLLSTDSTGNHAVPGSWRQLAR